MELLRQTVSVEDGKDGVDELHLNENNNNNEINDKQSTMKSTVNVTRQMTNGNVAPPDDLW